MKISIKKQKFWALVASRHVFFLTVLFLKSVQSLLTWEIYHEPNGGCNAEIDARMCKASKIFGSWKKRVFTNRQFSISTKMKIFCALVRPVLLYRCETWSVTQANLQRLNTFHMRCIWLILGVSRWNIIKYSDNLEQACEDPIAMTIQRQQLHWAICCAWVTIVPQNTYFAADLVMQQDQHMGLNRDG